MFEDGDVAELTRVLSPLEPNLPDENGQVDLYHIDPSDIVENNDKGGKSPLNM